MFLGDIELMPDAVPCAGLLVCSMTMVLTRPRDALVLANASRNAAQEKNVPNNKPNYQ